MSIQPNHYEVLGLPLTATAEQIKRRYRELARKYHPDVNPSPDAANKILSVNQAYQILGDADRRAAYDAERALRQPAPRPGRPSTPTSTPPRPRRPSAQPPNPRGKVYYDGFGRSYSPPKSERRPSAPPNTTPPKQMPDSQETSIERVLTEAKLAFINRQFQQAQRLCQDVLKINPREAIAHEILGDVYVRKGDTQRASTSFAYAIQFNPRNHSAQAKLERLMRASAAPANGPTITYTRESLHHSPMSRPASDVSLALITLLAGGVLLVTPVLLAMYPGSSIGDGIVGIGGLTFNLLLALAVSGAASGILLAFYGRMRPFTEEIWSRQREDGSRSPVPLGAVLSLFALLWFYGSFLVYVGIAALRNRFSPSILRAYAATLALVFLFALAYRPAGVPNPTLLATVLAGNILFPAVLFGWLLGDAFRLRGRI